MKQIVAALKPFFDEHKAALRRVALGVAKLNDEMAEVKEAMATKAGVSVMFGRLHTTIDDFIPLVEAARLDRTRASDAYMLVQRKFKDHDSRLTRLENKPA